MTLKCPLCGDPEPAHNCDNCGKEVCQNCFNHENNLCIDCDESKEE